MLVDYFGGFHLPSLYWKGTLSLRYYRPGKGYTGKVIKLGEYSATVSYYYRDMRRVLRAALARARGLTGFRAFGRPTLLRCGGEKRCGDWAVRALGRRGLFVTFRGARHVLDVKEEEELVKVGEEDTGKPGMRLQDVGFGPVLQHRLGALQVDVASISSGFTRYMGAPFGWHDKRCRGVVTCVPPANLEQHQASFDLVRVVEVPDAAIKPAPVRRLAP